MSDLIGIGVYTPAEASRLINVPAGKIARWLRGHVRGGLRYEPLWQSAVSLEDGSTLLSFRDLMEARVVDAFIKRGLSAQRVRAAIKLAQAMTGLERPLSTRQFSTDGKAIFLQTIEKDERGRDRERLLDLFRRQYTFKQIVDPLLRPIDFDETGVPTAWWPMERRAQIIVDPSRSFGQPIEVTSSVPTAVLAAAGQTFGAAEAASLFAVARRAVERALTFERRHGDLSIAA